jgi:hypothetical protein
MFHLFNIDLHISVIEDIKYIINVLYGEKIKITDNSISGHAWVFNKSKENIDIVNENTWKNINDDMINAFYQRYKDELSKYDGFIVTHTPVFALLYEKFNKPIIIVNSTRYEQPYSFNNDINSWEKLGKKLYELYIKKQGIFISNNKADQEYLKVATGIESTLIPSLCLYTNASYNPITEKYVVYNNFNIPEKSNIINKCNLFGNKYTWRELYSQKGIIHIPYEVSTMSLFEQYTANVPLFIPSKNYLKELIKQGLKFQSRYNRIYGNFSYPEKLKESLSDETWIDYWVDKSDYYDTENFNHITYFNNNEELVCLLEKTNTNEISNKMKNHNAIRFEKVYKMWKKIIDTTFNLNIEENNCKYICSVGFRKSCDIKDLHETNHVEHYDFTKLNDYDTLYIKTDALNDFSKKISNIKNKFILLSGCSDYSISVDVLSNQSDLKNILDNENLIHWYAQNNVYSHPKLSMLPIGLDYHTMYRNDIYWGEKKTPFEQENELIEFKNLSKPFWEREVKIYSNCHFLTSTKFGWDRIDAINTIPNELMVLQHIPLDRKTTWINQTSYSFVLSPHGNGLDCHRTWEALVLGSIPIVKKSPIDELYEELPVLIVNDWKEINVELLTNTIENFKNKHFNYEKLTMKYWMEKIKNSR